MLLKHVTLRALFPFVFIFVYLLLDPFGAKGQTFVRNYGTVGANEGGMRLIPIDQKRMILVGYKEDSTVIMILDPDGNVMQSRTFKFTYPGHFERVRGVLIDHEGKLVCAGRSDPSRTHTGFVFRYDFDNDVMLWSRVWDDNGSTGRTVLEPKPGRIVVLGAVWGNNTYDDGLIRELDLYTGMVVKQYNYYLATSEAFFESVLFNNKLYTVGRYAIRASSHFFRSSMTCFDLNYDILHSRSYFVDSINYARQYPLGLTVLSDSTLLAGGEGDRNGILTSNTTVFLSKHLLDTRMIWGYDYDFLNYQNEVIRGVKEVGNQLIANGMLENSNASVFLFSTDQNGTPRWCRNYGRFAIGESHVVHWNNSLYVTAISPVRGIKGDICLLRLNADGSLDDSCGTDTIHVTQFRYTLDYPNNLRRDTTARGDSSRIVVSNPYCRVDSLVCGTLPDRCFAAADSNFITVNPSGPLIGPIVWHGKIYIPSGVIVEISGPGSILDVTNVDVVFGEGAGLNVVNQASVRANNSVFRPCDPSKAWKGIYFENPEASSFKECTFKNAQVALDFKSKLNLDEQFDCPIHENSFFNNWISIRMEGGSHIGGIHNNTFSIDGKVIDFFPRPCPSNLPPYNNHTGIQLNGSQLNSPVSENSFVNNYANSGSNRFYGIFGNGIRGTFSSNHFSNTFRGIELTNSGFISIEYNQFEITQNISPVDNQIRISGNSSWVWILGNELRNSNEYLNYNLASTGIYVAQSSIINIKENNIRGFSSGIRAYDLVQSQISQNHLENQNLIGVSLDGGLDVDVNCNEINPRYVHNNRSHGYGVGYVKWQGVGQSLSFRSNCIQNTYSAIYVVDFTGGHVPVIRNNFLFDYEYVGLYNVNMSGSIGTGLLNKADAGSNSFFSNNAGYRGSNPHYDVASTTPILLVGNKGIRRISQNVSLNGNGMYGSTAACGNDPGDLNSEIILDDQCDLFQGQMDTLQHFLRKGQFSKIKGFLEYSGADLYRWGKAIGQYLLREGNREQVRHLLTYLQFTGKLDEALYTRLKVELEFDPGHIGTRDEDNHSDTQKSDWGRLTTIESRIRKGETLRDQDRNWLIARRNLSGFQGDLVRDWLRLLVSHTDYQFKTPYLPNFELDEPPVWVDEQQLIVYPNPGNGAVELNYNLDEPGGGQLKVFSVQGNLIFEDQLASQSGKVAYDWSHFRAGVYFLRLSSLKGKPLSIKWVKVD